MDAKAPTATAGPRSYQDFEPVSDWVQEEGSNTVIIQVPGFKKEHLKVQLGANLRVSGERQLDGNRWSRFRKEFQVPENCDVNGIRAKFENGLLSVILPKHITRVVDAKDQPMTSPEPPVATAEPKPSFDRQDMSQKGEPATSDEPEATAYDKTQEKKEKGRDFADGECLNGGTRAETPVTEHATSGGAKSWQERVKYGKGGISMGLLSKPPKLIVNVVVAVLVLVGIGMYVTYKLRRSTQDGIGN